MRMVWAQTPEDCSCLYEAAAYMGPRPISAAAWFLGRREGSADRLQLSRGTSHLNVFTEASS